LLNRKCQSPSNKKDTAPPIFRCPNMSNNGNEEPRKWHQHEENHTLGFILQDPNIQLLQNWTQLCGRSIQVWIHIWKMVLMPQRPAAKNNWSLGPHWETMHPPPGR
jgi:hypothetical protein